jgi:hypothetical protein
MHNLFLGAFRLPLGSYSALTQSRPCQDTLLQYLGAAEDPSAQSRAERFPRDIIRCNNGLHFTDYALTSNMQFIIPTSCGKLPTDIGVPSGGSLTADQWMLLATVYGPIAVRPPMIAVFLLSRSV